MIPKNIGIDELGTYQPKYVVIINMTDKTDTMIVNQNITRSIFSLMFPQPPEM